MSYRVGEPWPLSIDVTEKDINGVEQPTNPTTITLVITPPVGSPIVPTITNPPLVEGKFPYVQIVNLEGLWLAAWTTTGPSGSRTEWITVYPAPTAFEPNAREIADIIPRRAIGDDGLVGGTFTDDTMPTGEQAEEIGRQVAEQVLTAIGGLPFPAIVLNNAEELSRITNLVRLTVAVGAAADLELAYFPEDKNTTYAALTARFLSLLATLRATLVLLGVDVPAMPDPGGSGPGGPLAPYLGPVLFSFPAPRVREIGY